MTRFHKNTSYRTVLMLTLSVVVVLIAAIIALEAPSSSSTPTGAAVFIPMPGKNCAGKDATCTGNGPAKEARTTVCCIGPCNPGSPFGKCKEGLPVVGGGTAGGGPAGGGGGTTGGGTTGGGTTGGGTTGGGTTGGGGGTGNGSTTCGPVDGAKLTFKIFEHGMGSTPLEAKNDARTKAVKIARDNCQVTTSPACAPGCLDAGEVVRYKTYPFVVVFSPDPPEQTGTNPDMFRTFASIGKDAGFLNQSQENYCYTRRNCEKGCSAKEADFNVTGRKVINSRTQGIANSQAKADLAAEGARTALLANCNGTSLACNTAPNNNKCKDGTPTGRLFKWETTSNGQRQRTFITDLDSIEPASVSVGQITGGWQTIAVMGDAGGGLKAIYCHAEKPCNLP